MKRRLASLLIVTLWCVLPGFAETKPTTSVSDGPVVELPPVIVEASFTDVRFRARFRYHIPGNALKELVFTKVPKSWEAKGIAKGDALVGVDGTQIDGLGIGQLVGLIEPKEGQPIDLEIRRKRDKTVFHTEVVFKRDSGELTIHYP
jgi:hypothetical protein